MITMITEGSTNRKDLCKMSEEARTTIRKYIQKYAKKHGVTFKEAKGHAICVLTELYLKENNDANK